jgi:hypothetical protein
MANERKRVRTDGRKGTQSTLCTNVPVDSAEHARATNEDEPCDDGSAGNA